MISYITVVFMIGLAAGGKDLKRTNAGVIFKSRGTIQSSSSVWYHTFALDLPILSNKWLHYQMADPIIPPMKSEGNWGGSACSMPVMSMSNFIISLNAEVVKTYESLLDLTRTLIPKHVSSHQQRKKRFAPLSFIGSISKPIFGTATEEDVERVSSNVNELRRRQRLTAKTMVTNKRNFQSFVKLSSSLFDGSKKIVSDNHEALKMIMGFEVNNTDMINRRIHLLKIAMFQMNKTNAIIHHLRDVGQAIEQLAQGYLSPLIVSGKAIRRVVEKINNRIIDITNTKDHSVLADYGFGHHNSFFCQLQGNTLLITLKFQVVPLLRKAHLYQVMVYPVPTSKNSKHATKIAGLPEYVIISDDNAGKTYSPISSVQLSNCRGIHHVVCPFNLVYTTVLKENCITSLIKDSSDNIAKFCDFRYFHDQLEPSIEPISDNTFLVYDIPRISLHIRGHIKDVEGCHFCIFTIPCHARIVANDMTIDRVLSQKCNDEGTEVTREHLVNLAMVEAFIAEENHLGLTASSVFSKAQDVKIPKFDFFDHRFQEFLATDQKTNLKLDKMVEASKRQEKIFQNIAEPFIKTTEEKASQLTWNPSIVDIVVIICLIVGTVVLIRIIFLVKTFNAIIAVSELGKGLESRKLDTSAYDMIQSGGQSKI